MVVRNPRNVRQRLLVKEGMAAFSFAKVVPLKRRQRSRCKRESVGDDVDYGVKCRMKKLA
ncbi:MAG: hypothetical protein ACLR78_01540 [Roseburia sp.]